MGSEVNPEPSSTASPNSNSKRSRDPEDEVYIDNLHSHKRYLTEMMASSLNCLTVGDSLPDNPLDSSPARSESMSYFRDDASLQYSPMSEDSDDARYYETSVNMCSSHPESAPSSPVSPYRYPKPSAGFSPSSASTSYASHVSGMISSQSRQRASECEGRFPSSPSDICHSADLRRAALMRSVQMRTQSPGPGPSHFEAPLSPNHEPVHIMEAEEQSCSYEKSTVDDIVSQVGLEYPINSESNSEKPCTMLELKERDTEPAN